MKLQRIRYFVTLAQTLSFSRTAEVHCVSQTTVSQQIRLLERELGCDLFERTKRRVRLTPAGEQYLPEARRALDILDRAEERVRLLHSEERAPLRVALAQGVTPAYIAGPLRDFAQEDPGVALECSYLRAREAGAALATDEADVALLFDMGFDRQPGIERRRLAELAQYVVVSSRSRLAAAPALTHAQLAEERFVNSIDSRGANPLASVTDDAEAAGWVARSSERGPKGPADVASMTDVMVDGMNSLLLAVALGEGYTLLSEPMAQAIAPGLGVARVPLAGERVPLVACWRQGSESALIRRFVDFLASRLA